TVVSCLTSGNRQWSWRDSNKIEQKNEDNNITTNGKRKDNDPPEDTINRKTKKAKSQRFVTDETADLNTRKPETNQDFERALLGSPNSSVLWLQYLAHQIGMGEIQKAREIGARALETINQVEETERMNVHKALISLEVQFGSEEDVARVFTSALQVCNAKPLYFALADDYEVHGKIKAAEETYRNMMKKFPEDLEVCSKFGLFLFQQGKNEIARELHKTCLKRFEKRDQIQITTKFATMEFKHGEAERGRTIFERLVQDNRKRSDIWSVWIDMEIKILSEDTNKNNNTNIEKVRALFERVTAITFSSKVMKFLLNKWMKFEEEFGTLEYIEKVKLKAINYVDSKRIERV
ncbi:3637_t:CDS:2, partial [Ambispora leptoticha]